MAENHLKVNIEISRSPLLVFSKPNLQPYFHLSASKHTFCTIYWPLFHCSMAFYCVHYTNSSQMFWVNIKMLFGAMQGKWEFRRFLQGLPDIRSDRSLYTTRVFSEGYGISIKIRKEIRKGKYEEAGECHCLRLHTILLFILHCLYHLVWKYLLL